MAKKAKKLAEAKPKPTPTDDQLKLIAARVRGTRANVYQVAEGVCGFQVGEVVFDLLQEKHGLFRCEECSTWKGLSSRADFYGPESFICFDCEVEMRGDDEEDEE